MNNLYTFSDLLELESKTPEVKSLIDNGKFVFDDKTTDLTFVYLGNGETFVEANKNLNIELKEIEFETEQPKLLYLDASYCNIENIVIKNCPNLQTLYLNNNKIKSIKFEGKFDKLEFINLDRNQLTEINLDFENIPNLQHLYLHENKLTDLNNLSKYILKTEDFDLAIRENTITNPPKEIVDKGFDAIKNFYIQLQEQDVDYIFEAKLLIIGEPGAGKTSLRKKLKDEKCELPKPKESTWGIDVEPVFLTIQKNKIPKACKIEKLTESISFRMNVWDFAGQDIYHATHRFFLTDRSVYALVADQRKEDTDFKYWLHIVEKFGGISPLIIVQNQKEERKKDINENDLKASFPNLKQVIPVNLGKIDNRFHTLSNEIEHLICNLPQIGDAVPAKWKVIREKLEKINENYISQRQYFKLCDDEGIKERESQLLLSTYFHEIGVFLHFKDDKLLRDTIFLKPEWVTKAVYVIVESDIIKQKHGKFTENDIEKIWEDEKYSEYNEKFSQLIQLMKHFMLIYQTENGCEFVLPQLLKNEVPKYYWNLADNRKIKYDFRKFMPKGILWQLIVKLSKYLKSDELVWQRGVILERDNTRAEIIENYETGFIFIAVEGLQKKILMNYIIDNLDEINARYTNLDVEKLIPCNCNICKNADEVYEFSYNILKIRLDNGKDDIECQKPPFKKVNIKQLLEDYEDKEKHLREFEKVTTMKYNLKNISKLLNSAFNDTDLTLFCQVNNEFEKVYNNVGNGQNKTQKIISLIDFSTRNILFDRLLEIIEEEHNAQFEANKPYILSLDNAKKSVDSKYYVNQTTDLQEIKQLIKEVSNQLTEHDKEIKQQLTELQKTLLNNFSTEIQEIIKPEIQKLTDNQTKIVSEILKDLEENKPEFNMETYTLINSYLEKISSDLDNLKIENKPKIAEIINDKKEEITSKIKLSILLFFSFIKYEAEYSVKTKPGWKEFVSHYIRRKNE